MCAALGGGWGACVSRLDDDNIVALHSPAQLHDLWRFWLCGDDLYYRASGDFEHCRYVLLTW